MEVNNKKLNKPYSYGPYNKFNDTEQWIRITEGCPHNCEYCYEPKEYKVFGIPEIIRNDVSIMDMNFLCKPECYDILKELADKRVNSKVVYYKMICGFDFRFITEEIAVLMKEARFKKIRIAWDREYIQQFKLKDTIKNLIKVGYKPRNIQLFMICNWKIPYDICLKKLDLTKVWGVQVADCYFDGQVSPNIEPIHWTKEQIKDFRRRCRKHNQLVSFGIDPNARQVGEKHKQGELF